MHKILLLCSMLLLISTAFSQSKKNRLQPGRLYDAGETLYAPRFGFIAKVPEGWQGMLPRESEVFLLSTTTSTYGEIFVFGREQMNLELIKENWLKGINLSETIKLKASSANIQEGVLTAEVFAAGDFVNKGYKGFAIAKCNPAGPCIITLMVAPAQFYEAVKISSLQFMQTSSFESPSGANPYADFDWKAFLSDKVLATYQAVQGGSKESTIHLCANGTFQADIKKSGILKSDKPEYKGKHTGKWSVTGSGEQTTIQFFFNKENTPPIEATLSIKDEQVYSGSERYFVGASEKCK